MIYKFFPVLFLLFSSFSSNPKIVSPNSTIAVNTSKETTFENTNSAEAKALDLYNSLNTNNLSLPKLESFTQALKGFYALQSKGVIKKNILTLIDFSLSSNTKRFNLSSCVLQRLSAIHLYSTCLSSSEASIYQLLKKMV
jgi:hypothetical protein